MKFWIVLLLILSAKAFATTKGLSQIVTPDIQNPADLSVSYQVQNPAAGNANQLQAELGLTPWFEIAAFQGFSPDEGIFGTEFSLYQHEPYLLSAGFINLSTRYGIPQPFLESGYYTDTNKWMVGGIEVDNKTEALLGWAYDFDKHWRGQVDYQGGTENFSTIGFTYTWNPSWQFNPAIFMSNDSKRSLYGYAVLTYTFAAWQTKYPKAPDQPEGL